MNIVKLWLILPKRKIIWTSIMLEGLPRANIFFCVCALVHNALRLPFFFFFFSFFSFSAGFWTDCFKLFSKRFIINYQGTVWPRSDSFLGHTKRSFRKKCSSSCYSRLLCHTTQDSYTWHKIATYILLVDMIMMMKWLYTYWPTINKQNSLNKPTRKRNLFKE